MLILILYKIHTTNVYEDTAPDETDGIALSQVKQTPINEGTFVHIKSALR